MTESKWGVRTLKWLMEDSARARAPGSLKVYSQEGPELKHVYQRYDRTISSRVRNGRCHAEVLYSAPYLIMGSSNWSVSSEGNVEMDVVLNVRGQEMQSYVQSMMDKMKHGATLIDVQDVGKPF